MAIYDPHLDKIVVRVVYDGPAFAGKTTNLKKLHDSFTTRRRGSLVVPEEHFPIRDMHVPPVGRAQTLVADLWRWADRGEPVAVHCKAGLGRTGTILGAYLAWGGATGEASIQQVRAMNAAVIQNAAQRAFHLDLRRRELIDETR